MKKIAAKIPGMGIPNPSDLGEIMALTPGLYPYVVQRHDAQRAGLHHDLRFGRGKMYSWAVPKLVPDSSGSKRRLAIQQPLHAEPYMHYQGKLEGYGAGTVKTEDKGEVLVTKVSPTSIHYTVAHKRYPERYVLKKMDGKKDWLLVNVTPTVPPNHQKPSYRVIPAEQVETVFKPDMSVEAKIDGARVLAKVLKDKIEVTSYRVSKENKPILHTERVFGKQTYKNIPKDLIGTELVGELYGTRKGKAIPVQELSGLLNSTVSKTLKDKAARNIQMRIAVFDILSKKALTREERAKKLKSVISALKTKELHVLPSYKGQKARQLWSDVAGGKHPLTQEGVIAWPSEGVPSKVKALQEQNVFIQDVYPEIGHPGKAGGFRYSLEPEGPIVGSVGTGFTDEMRKNLFQDKESLIGRTARIRSQGQFDSGAYRAPAFLSLAD